jgi:hypothetical protein
METRDKINVRAVGERLYFDICLTAEELGVVKNNINIQEDVAPILLDAPYVPLESSLNSLSVMGYQRSYFQYPTVSDIRKYLFSCPFIREMKPIVLCPVINWIQDHKDFFKDLGIAWIVVFSGNKIFGVTLDSARVVTFSEETEWNEGSGLFLFERVIDPEPKFHN